MPKYKLVLIIIGTVFGIAAIVVGILFGIGVISFSGKKIFYLYFSHV